MSVQSWRSETSTLVAVASGAALEEVHGAFEKLVRSSGVRPIIVTFGNDPAPVRTGRNQAYVLDGLVPRYLNNAVASLRLSSLPAIGWWREPSTEGILELADLVDRLILDVEEPSAAWGLLPQLSGRTAVSDRRWAGLTRWRDLFAQFFDLPEIRDRADSLSHLSITAGDRHSARLLAGWIVSRLPGGTRLEVAIEEDDSDAPIRALQIAGRDVTLSLQLLPNDICLRTVVDIAGSEAASRVVAAGDASLAASIGEELRVRSRDLAFEDAVAAAGGIE